MSILQDLLSTALTCEASDVHVMVNSPPLLRIHTVLQPTDFPVITPEESSNMLREMVGNDRYAIFEKNRDLDFSTEIKGIGRFRVNAHFQRGSVAIAFRVIPDKVFPLESLNLPEPVTRLIDLPRGLVLVTGDTGSGKSTTLAAMIDAMNKKYNKHIITLEDPIEFLRFQ